MNYRPTIQERAYQLTAEYATIAEIRRQLMKERYENVDSHLAARSMRLTLKRMCRAAAKARQGAQALAAESHARLTEPVSDSPEPLDSASLPSQRPPTESA
jgi:uncharacterized membrane-anchored protein YhcB (DUF1043 family)